MRSTDAYGLRVIITAKYVTWHGVGNRSSAITVGLVFQTGCVQ